MLYIIISNMFCIIEVLYKTSVKQRFWSPILPVRCVV